jgi:hypothetical protein
MNGCVCKRGFFSLRDCGDPIAARCAACGREVCAAHLSPASGFTKCLDCHARGAAAQERPAAGTPAARAATPPAAVSPAAASGTQGDDEWVYGYRDSYYRRGYRPIYAGYYYDHYYDSYDTRTFDRAAAAGPVDDSRDAEADFGES